MTQQTPSSGLQASNSFTGMATPRALKRGDRLDDGTIVFFVDPKQGAAFVVSDKIFVGNGQYEDQDKVIATANQDKLHGHSDWRKADNSIRFSRENGYNEAYMLREAWPHIASPQLQAAPAVERTFWLADKIEMSYMKLSPCVLTGGTNVHDPDVLNHDTYQIPAVRKIPAYV